LRFIYRTLAILALAIAAGLTHSWFVPVATSFGTGDERRRREPAPPPEPGRTSDGEAAGGEAGESGVAPQPGQDEGVDEQQAAPVTTEQPDVSPEHTPPPAQPAGEEIDIDALGDFINVEEARAIWREGNEEFHAIVAFVDARFPDQYAFGHITGARRLLAHEFTDGTGADTLNWLLEQEPDIIVIYCEGGDCDASKNLARQLELNAGFAREQLHVLQPGYPAWADKYPDLTTKGDEPGEP
jgi:rhodanese-related sulfurtransferase